MRRVPQHLSAPIIAVAGIATAFLLQPVQRAVRAANVCCSAEAVETLDYWQEQAIGNLGGSLLLQSCGEERFTLSGGAACVRSWKGASQADPVSWASALSLDDEQGSLRTLTVWNAPTTEVPHLHLRLASSSEAIHLEIDYRHRLAAGYEQQKGGAYPEPTNREEFAQAGMRAAFDEAYFTPEVRQWCDAVRRLAGAQAATASSEGVVVEGRRQFGGSVDEPCHGPLLISLLLPPGATSAAAAATACGAALQWWLGWAGEAKDASWMNNRRIYDRDCLVRVALTRASVVALAARCGDEGRRLALADFGPQDMMGHNLMQEQGGFGSDPDEGRD